MRTVVSLAMIWGLAPVLFSSCLVPPPFYPAPPPPPLPPDAIACVCPGLPGRMSSPCSQASPEDAAFFPLDGTVTIHLSSKCTNPTFTDPLLGAPACQATLNSGNLAVLQFVPNQVSWAQGSDLILANTAAVDPWSLQPPQSSDVTFTAVDSASGVLLATGRIMVGNPCQ